MQKEPFGPVAMINRVSSVEQAITLANRLPFGLSAFAFTRSARTAQLLAEEIEAGTLAINHFGASVPETPFGGVKDSGFGREGGAHGVAAFTVVKAVAHLTRT
jgi:succinate-semialdehyde dehydrogenase/glutarate-semialdehyde dehydrogenase